MPNTGGGGPQGDRIYRQEIDDSGIIHYYDVGGDEIFPAFHPVHKHRWQALTTWIIIFSGAVIFILIFNNHTRDKADQVQQAQIREQRQRLAGQDKLIHEIQVSRLLSCRQNYLAFQRVFQPLIPPPRLQTPQVKKNVAKFNHAILVNRAKCAKQVAVSGGQP